MTEKIYKNKNMIRTKHNVRRVICFEGELERERFIKLYEDLFDKYSKIDKLNYHDETCRLRILLPKKVFDEIVQNVGLINIKTQRNKTTYWRTEGAVV